MTTDPGTPDQDDLTALDGEFLLVNTDKLAEDDDGLEQPPQDPGWVPTVVEDLP